VKYLLLRIFKCILKIVYFFLKLLPTNSKKVVFISRQQNVPSLDFKLLSRDIKSIDSSYQVVFLCKKMKTNKPYLIRYCFHLIRQMYHLATSKVCVVDSYCICVSVLKHKKSLTIIQIWHAIATVKKFGYQTLSKKYGRNQKTAKILKMHNNYDWVISGSTSMIPVFAETFNVSLECVKPIGTPRIDYLINNNRQIMKKVKTKYPELNKKKVILYAPTFRKKENLSFDKIIDTVDFDKYNLIIKSHPVKKEKVYDSRVYKCPEFSTMELLTIADYVITDYSAISIEAAILNKPVFFYIYDYEKYIKNNGLNIDLKREMKGCCYKKFNSLYQKINVGKYDYEQLKKFKDKYVSHQQGNSGLILANYIVNGKWTVGKEDENE
jgi:CDP-ribitol ribitolphosphotransferase